MSEWRYASVDVSNNIFTITAVPTLVHGGIVTVGLSNHTLPIKDGTNTVLVIEANATENTKIQIDDGVRFEQSLIVDPDDAATGRITIFYKILGHD